MEPEEQGGIPGWLGPIVGPLVGGLLALHSFSDEDHTGLGLVGGLAIGAGLGLAAGLVVWWLDARKRRKQ
jgi:MFS family permease